MQTVYIFAVAKNPLWLGSRHDNLMKNFTSRRMNKIINAKHFDSYAANTSGTEM